MPVNLTREGYERLREELNHLKSVKRLEIADALETARLKGDLRENAEYDAAKEAQAHLEKRISQMETILMDVRIIDHEAIDASKAYIGATVTLLDEVKREEVSYMLVSKEEADFKQKKISVESPIGRAIVGKGVNESVEITIPAGKLRYKIMDIRR